MKRKILIAVDNLETSMGAVAHAGDIVSGCKDVEITLYHIVDVPHGLQSVLPQGLQRPDDEGWFDKALRKERRRWREEIWEKAEKEVFVPAKQILTDRGVREDVTPIRCKLDSDQHPDVALSIVREAKIGGYSAIVLGRRRSSLLREFVLGSTVSKVIHHDVDCAVWVVESTAEGQRKSDMQTEATGAAMEAVPV